MPPVYLDHNATTPILPAALDAVVRAFAAAGGNPSSQHAAGRKARRVLDDARESVAANLGAHPDEVVFTGGATEANNLAVFGLDSPGDVWCSRVEHPCVTEPVKQLAGRGVRVNWLPADGRGVTVLPASFAGSRVFLMLANHETGAMQPVREVADRGGVVHTDAAQAVGKIPVNFRELGAATLALSGHKFRGPAGVGVLLVRKGVPLKSQVFGGHQERGRRPGTESPPLAAGLAVALAHAVRNMTATAARWNILKREFLDWLVASCPGVVVNGPAPGDADSLPNTLNVSFPGRRADLLLMSLDLAGVACSAGAACASGSVLPSPVLTAMGLPADRVGGAVRFSMGEETTAADVTAAAAAVSAWFCRENS